MEIIRSDQVSALALTGVISHQLLCPENSASTGVTITKVVVQPGGVNPRHRHPTSEQVWVALRGAGTLLLESDSTAPFSAGDIARFADGDVHGFQNTGTDPFEYLAVTAPPIDCRDAYAAR